MKIYFSFHQLLATALVAVVAGGLAGVFFPPVFDRVFVGARYDLERPADDRAGRSVSGGRDYEEEAVVRVASEASHAVVSVIVERPANSLMQESGPFLFEQFEFPFPFEAPRSAPAPKNTEPDEKKDAAEDSDNLVRIGGGTGFIVSADGFIVTNRHVIDNDDAVYQVALSDGRSHAARVVAKDSFLDIGILKIEAQNLPTLNLGDSDKIQIGQTVIAIGNALSEFSNTVTRGIISGVGRRVLAGGFGGGSEVIEEAIQTDAAINPGNSGGPLLNVRGEVIGVATATSLEGESVSFAIPINAVKRIIDSVKEHGRIVRAWLGIRYSLITPAMAKVNKLPVDHGALVARGDGPNSLAVIPGSPADKAGIEENNIVLEFDGQRIDVEHSLALMVSKRKPGDQVRLKIYDDGAEREIEVQLGEFPEDIK